MNRLGTLWMSGGGGQADPIEAANWYRKAAARGFAEAQFNLGVCCAEGKGVAADPVEAWCWLQLAAGQQFPAAAAGRDRVQAGLSSAQLEEARRRVARTEFPTNAPTASVNTNGSRFGQITPPPQPRERGKK
jgi:TPR repeat protein